jgi:hypothetical protein
MATRRPATRSGGRSSKTRTSSTSSSKTRSSRTRAPESEARPGRRGKAKKKNNAPLFIGIGVGAFVLLMIIIVAASGGDDGNGSGAGTGDSYMSVSQKQSIFKDYMSQCAGLEQDVKDALAGMDADTRKKASRGTYKNLRNRKVALANRMEGKYNKTHKKVPEGYFLKNIVQYGEKNGWK